MRSRNPKPAIYHLEELIGSVKSGDIRLPKFQRPFVWSKSDVTDLLDSIFNGYPIGSILLWHSSERLKSEREIIGYKISDEKNEEVYPTDYILDGQQRLTSLCASLNWNGNDNPTFWNICFDLDSCEFVHIKGAPQENHFPINKLLDTTDYIKQCMRLQSSKFAAQYIHTADLLLKAFRNYQIAVVKIGDVTLDEVAPIFERINSTGRKLTIVDLMRAATWSDGFDLSTGIEKIDSVADELDLGSIGDPLIVRSIAASAGLGINKADIEKLRKLSTLDLNSAINSTEIATRDALLFLQNHCNIGHISYLPYQLQFTLLVEFFNLSNNQSTERLEALKRWFWRTSISRQFASATTSQIKRHLEEFRCFAKEEICEPKYIDGSIDIQSFFLDEFVVRNASSIAFALLLKSNSPKKTLQGKELNDTLSLPKDKRHFGCIVPKTSKYCDANISRVFGSFKLSKGSRLPLSSACDIENHFIDHASFAMLIKEDYDSAIERRISIMQEFVNSLVNKPQ